MTARLSVVAENQPGRIALWGRARRHVEALETYKDDCEGQLFASTELPHAYRAAQAEMMLAIAKHTRTMRAALGLPQISTGEWWDHD